MHTHNRGVESYHLSPNSCCILPTAIILQIYCFIFVYIHIYMVYIYMYTYILESKCNHKTNKSDLSCARRGRIPATSMLLHLIHNCVYVDWQNAHPLWTILCFHCSRIRIRVVTNICMPVHTISHSCYCTLLVHLPQSIASKRVCVIF